MMKRLFELRSQPARKPSGFCILYVEDEDQNWEIAELSLRDRYSLTRVRTAQEAFALLAKRTFDAILMDIQLSGSDMDGIEITKALRGLRGDRPRPGYAKVIATDVPIIYVTAYGGSYSLDQLLATGGDELITKPVDFTHLALAITRLMLRRMNRTLRKKVT